MLVARRAALTILLVFVSSFFLIPKTLPPLHAATATGEVCITISTTATTCPASRPTVGPLLIGSTFDVGVFVQGSDAMGGFEIYVSSDPAFVNPTSAALGPLIADPLFTSICVNGASTTGSCTANSANGPGVVQVTTIESSGGNECGGISPCSGMAFTITYTVVGSTPSTSLSYPTHPACSQSSVSPPPNVCVQVADAFGTTLSENIQGAIVAQGVAPLTAGFSYNPPSPQTGRQVTFYGVASGGVSSYTYAWTFGDGATASGSTVNHTYSSAGSYAVVLTVEDSDSPQKTASTQATLTVVNPPPPPPPLTASYAFSPSSPQTGQPITFSSSTSGGTPPYTSSWSFGDGSQATGSTATHTYSYPGSYTVYLFASDSGSPAQTVSSQQLITVTGAPPPPPSGYVLSWQGYDWDGGREETVYLNGNAVASLPLTDVGGNGGAWASISLDITSFLVQGTYMLTFAHAGWDCGITDNVSDLLITSGSSVVYSNSASLPLSCAQSLTYTFTIGTVQPPPPPPPLTLTESFDTANPIVGETCSFRGLASGGVPPYSFSWDFGDSVSGFGSSVTHIYTAPGTYAVTLTVRDSASPSSSTLRVTGYQTVSAPPTPSAGTYTLSWQGYDWDGGGEETITLNGLIITALPGIDTPSNGAAWAPFSLNVTSYVVTGTNTLTFTHANWDCSISDYVRNLQVTSGTTVIYSNPDESPLSCTQTLTYTFTG